MSNEEITVERLKTTIKRIKRRKGINTNSDITMSMIAKELGCSRQTLYKRKDLDETLSPFKKIIINSLKDTIKIGTREYYKKLSQEREKEIISLNKEVSKLKNKIIDYHVLEKNLLLSEEKFKRLGGNNQIFHKLENENQYLKRRLNSIIDENEMLRKRLMNFKGCKNKD